MVILGIQPEWSKNSKAYFLISSFFRSRTSKKLKVESSKIGYRESIVPVSLVSVFFMEIIFI